MNKIRTTALIEPECIEMLYQFAAVKKQRVSKIVELVFSEIIKNKYGKKTVRLHSSVKYQTGGMKLVLFHYSVSTNIYEICLDMRKFNKMSVSRILNEGIRFLLGAFLNYKTAINETKSCFLNNVLFKLDNYAFSYLIICKDNEYTGSIVREIRLQIT